MNDNPLDSFLEYLEKEKNYSSLTILNYKKDIEAFLKYLVDQKELFDCLTRSTIRNYLFQLRKEGKEPSTIRRHISSLRHYYSYLEKKGVVDTNPFLHVSMPKKSKKLPSFFSHEEIYSFLDDNKKRTDYLAKRDQAIMELLFASGLRASELISLKYSQIDREEKTIRVMGKGKKERITHFTSRAKEALEDYTNSLRITLLGDKKDEGYVFLNKRGEKLSERGLEYLLENAEKKCGNTIHVHPHMFRHSFATELVNHDADLRVVQELLGHASISTTSIYTDVSYSDLEKMYQNCFPKMNLTEEKKMKKAVIFDFNGTMFFDEDKHVLSWRAFSKEEFDKEIKEEDFPLHIHGFNNKEILAFLGGREFSQEEVDAYALKKELYYQKICEQDQKNLHLVFGLEEFLNRLKENGNPIAICTASMKPNVDWYIKTFHLEKWFPLSNIIYDDGTLKRGKPDPEIYLRALNRLGVEGKDTIVFEDAVSGIQAAHQAKVSYIVALEEEKRREAISKLPGVKYVIKDYRELPKEIYEDLGL